MVYWFSSFRHHFDLVKRVKFVVSKHFPANAWREWPEILHADVSWPPSVLIRLYSHGLSIFKFWLCFDLMKQVKFVVSGHFLKNAWRDSIRAWNFACWCILTGGIFPLLCIKFCLVRLFFFNACKRQYRWAHNTVSKTSLASCTLTLTWCDRSPSLLQLFQWLPMSVSYKISACKMCELWQKLIAAYKIQCQLQSRWLVEPLCMTAFNSPSHIERYGRWLEMKASNGFTNNLTVSQPMAWPCGRAYRNQQMCWAIWDVEQFDKITVFARLTNISKMPNSQSNVNTQEFEMKLNLTREVKVNQSPQK